MKSIHLTITFDEGDARPIADLLASAIKQAMAVSAADTRKRPALQEDRGWLIDSKDVAKLLNVSARKLREMQASGAMPPLVRLGRMVKWSREDLKAWVDAGCPLDRKWTIS